MYSIEQMRDRARKRLPRFAFDFIDGGAGREQALENNVAALARLSLVPRVLRGIGAAHGATTLFGTSYAAPFGIAPMGLPALAWAGADLGLARAAEAAKIAFVLSTAASASIEQAVAVAPFMTWFQVYQSADPAHTAGLVARALAASVSVLVLTVDRPLMGWRTRDLTHGVGLHFRVTPGAVLSMAAHPAWTLATLLAGRPTLASPEAPGHGEPPARLDWAFLDMLRARWPHRLLVKGILHPDDARQAVAAGADGVVVSNHGGAHLESAPPSITRLAAIRAAVGPGAAVLFDGGVRSGEDIVKALAMGADFVLLGRAFAYAVAALGPQAGPARAIDLLTDQFCRALVLLGCGSPAELGRGHLTASRDHFMDARDDR